MVSVNETLSKPWLCLEGNYLSSVPQTKWHHETPQFSAKGSGYRIILQH